METIDLMWIPIGIIAVFIISVTLISSIVTTTTFTVQGKVVALDYNQNGLGQTQWTTIRFDDGKTLVINSFVDLQFGVTYRFVVQHQETKLSNWNDLLNVTRID